MTDPITRARKLLARQPPLRTASFEGYAWLEDKDGQICVGAYPDGKPRLDQAQAIALAVSIAGPLLDVLEAFSHKVRVDAIDDDWSCRWCGGVERHSPKCAVGIALAAIEKALEEVK